MEVLEHVDDVEIIALSQKPLEKMDTFWVYD